MDIVQRAKNICLNPANEWPVIAGETTTASSLITGYVVPLAAVSAAAGFIGGSVVGYTIPMAGTYRVSIAAGLAGAIFAIVMAVVSVFVISLVIDALAPTFGAQKNQGQALKVAAYSFTPAWVAGTLQVIPMLSVLALLGALYGLYLLYLGLPRLMKCPEDKAVGYTAVVVVCAIVVMSVVSVVGGVIVGTGAMGAAVMGGAATGGGGDTVRVDPDGPLGKLQQGLEESARKMEAAERSGDQGAQVAAAMEGLGALLGGGRRVDPVGIEELKPFLPDTFGALTQTSSSAERTGIAGLMVSKAEAQYGDGGAKLVTLEVIDTGGASGLMALAGWVGVEQEKEDQYGSERTARINGRLVHEKISNTGGTNEFGMVLGDRFLVSAEGRGVGIDELKAGVSRLDLDRLEAMKTAGAQQ